MLAYRLCRIAAAAGSLLTDERHRSGAPTRQTGVDRRHLEPTARSPGRAALRFARADVRSRAGSKEAPRVRSPVARRRARRPFGRILRVALGLRQAVRPGQHLFSLSPDALDEG